MFLIKVVLFTSYDLFFIVLLIGIPQKKASLLEAIHSSIHLRTPASLFVFLAVLHNQVEACPGCTSGGVKLPIGNLLGPAGLARQYVG